MMSAIKQKLLRELWQLRGQMLSIALVIATGTLTVTTMRGGYDVLVEAQQVYYRESRFADVWASLKRAPDLLAKKIELIPGVGAVDTRITFLATMNLDGLDAPGQARFVSLPAHGRPTVNNIRIRAGRYVVPGNPDEVIISENFADARLLKPGDKLNVVINGRARELDIVGTAISPEHTYAVPPGSLYPDDERYGVLWMSRDVLGPAYDMDGAFNEVLLILEQGANQQAVIEQLDFLLEPYGGLGAYLRKDQASHVILQGELDQNRVMGTAIPIVFLAVAAFLLNLVLGRLIATQRTEIAVLKAFGYSNREVGWHYLVFALVAVFAGTVIGIASGMWLGGAYMRLYGEYFDFPSLEFRLSPTLLLISFAVSTIAAVAGALMAVRRAATLPPAEAMRPEAPARYHAGWWETLGLSRWLSISLRMILRNINRKPVQTLLSSLGVAFSVAILLIGMFMFDGVRFLMDLQFREIQREDLTLIFNEPVDTSVYHELRRLPGVTRVETYRAVPVRLRFHHHQRTVAIQGLSSDGELRRIVTANSRVQSLPAKGIVLSNILAKKLNAKRGDSLDVDVLEGRRVHAQVEIAAVVEDFLGVSAYMTQSALHQLVAGPEMVTGAYLSVAGDQGQQLDKQLKKLPVVASVASPLTMLNNFETQLADSLFIAVGFLLGFASVIAVGVIYNGARIALSERGRELACLRVMGFRRGETAVLLLGEQALITLLAIPLGWLIGYVLSYAVVSSLETDTYRIPFVISPQTYIISALLTGIAATASGAIVRRRINQLDLIKVLKTRE